ncbi:MAG: hypothetical protein CMF48_01090 [Legionellales bacterium]|nr:hypothetical protein [Legionellales bacterium]|tara:strand:- start:816 stop:1043 length:228 start_codon:yes stop_codon:yes gene_type:complete
MLKPDSNGDKSDIARQGPAEARFEEKALSAFILMKALTSFEATEDKTPASPAEDLEPQNKRKLFSLCGRKKPKRR